MSFWVVTETRMLAHSYSESGIILRTAVFPTSPLSLPS